MGYKHFSLAIIIQSIFLVIPPVLIAMIWNYPNLIISRYALIVCYGLQVWGLISTVRKTNREVSRFIDSFRYNDATIHFHSQDRDGSFKDLFQSFNGVVEAFRKLKVDKEKEYQFFENALKNIGVAILVVNESGNVVMTNDALFKLLGIKYLHRLDKLNLFKKDLSQQLQELPPNQQKLIEIVVNGRLLQVAVTSVIMKQDEQVLKLLAFQDIRGEIEQKELESWQKLIRVLTHEVMNSLSPVNILSASLKQRFEMNDEAPSEMIELDVDDRLEMLEALDAIHSRSKGLTRFVESYRSLAGLKSAQTHCCNVNNLLSRIQILYQGEMVQRLIKHEVVVVNNIDFELDEKLVEQILINLVKNGMEAINHDHGKILMKAHRDNGHLIFQISDNGKGIPKEELDKVCVPFYTTRPHGNGIGLALSRQVMRLHGGQLKIHSEEGKGTRITLIF
ncbi:MAG: hypothetical protein JEZ14_13000 [Marinilabiliaceae bacterium]|nr:hypothetical protein [Marinilabiliaceae bacterium]